MSLTYLTTDELAVKIKYNARTIRQTLMDKVLIEGRHYVRPFGQRRILFIWEHIEEDMYEAVKDADCIIPLTQGGVCYG